MLILFSGRQEREEIEFVYQWIHVFLLLIYLPFPVLPLAYLSHTAPFLYFPTPPSTSSSSPLFLLSLLLLLFFPRYPTDLYWAVCLRSPLGQWMFKILASCNLSITRFRPAWLPTTGGHKETFIFCWPFWIFYKTRLPVKHSTSIWPSCPQITARIFQVKYFNVTLMYWQNFCHAKSQGFLLKSLGLNIFKDVL